MKDSQGKPLSDAIDGAMCWCPITNLTQADLSYEWMMGQFSSEGTRAYGTWTRSLSRDMARAYADSLNRMGLRDEQGNVLTLTQSESGIYMAGPYYDYLKTTIETSLNNFLKDNQFPLTTGPVSYTHLAGRSIAHFREKGGSYCVYIRKSVCSVQRLRIQHYRNFVLPCPRS